MKSITFFYIIYSFLNLNYNNVKENRVIYYSTSLPWYVFYDSTNSTNCDIVEIGGIKYGFIDKLDKVNKKDTISKSKNGVLFYKKKCLVYYNYNLKKVFKFNKVNYKSSFKEKRSKIFDTYAFLEVKKHHLKEENRNEVYKIIREDFEELETNKNKNCTTFEFEIFLNKIKSGL